MATERVAMHRLKKILRQKLVLKWSHREVARAVGVSVGLVSGVMSRAQVLQIRAEQVEELDDKELEEELYARPMRLYKVSRRELFEGVESAALKALPEDAFEYAEWKKTRLNIDYHIALDDHFYSAPHTLIHEELWVRSTSTAVEIFHRSTRVGAHARSYVKFKYTTVLAHMPSSHQKHAEWTPTRILGWAETVGPMTSKLAEAILAEHHHPEHGYRSCLGLLRLAKSYGNARVEAACARAFAASARSYRHVKSILQRGIDQAPLLDTESEQSVSIVHTNVRGPGYYH